MNTAATAKSEFATRLYDNIACTHQRQRGSVIIDTAIHVDDLGETNCKRE